MGLYIKGMDLTEIEKLVLTKNVQMIFIWTSDMKLTAITRTESDSGIVSYSKEFDVVEVLEPHGRLIDADELLNTSGVTINITGKENAMIVTQALDSIYQDIEDAPTVIEAEGE